MADNCRNIIPQSVKRLTGDQREVLPGITVSEDVRVQMLIAANEQDPKAMGQLLAGELDSFATHAATRGHEGLENVIHKLADIFQETDPNRAHFGTVEGLEAQAAAGAKALRTILADSDLTTPGGHEALINFASHIAADMQTMPATNLAIQSLVEGFFHSSRRLGQMIDAGQADVFTQARWIIETETFAALEGARKGIKKAAGRLLFSFRQDVPRARLTQLVEELFDSAQNAADDIVKETPALDQWRAARKATGVLDENAPGSQPPGVKETPAQKQRQGGTNETNTPDHQRTEGVDSGGKRGSGKAGSGQEAGGSGSGSGGSGSGGGGRGERSGTGGGRGNGGKGGGSGRGKRGGAAGSRSDLRGVGSSTDLRGRRGGTDLRGAAAGSRGVKGPGASGIMSAQEAAGIVERFGGKDRVRRSAAQQITQDVDRIKTNLEQVLGGKLAAAKNMGMEFWINGILSGPITHSVNFISNTAVTLWRPLEDAIIGIGSGNMKQVQGAIVMYGQLFEAYRTALRINGAAGRAAIKESTAMLRLASKATTLSERQVLERGARQSLRKGGVGPVARAFVTGDEQLVKGARQFDLPRDRAITGANAGLKTGGIGAQIVDAFGTGINAPGRLLSTMDELAKQVNYRMHLAKLAHESAQNAGVKDVAGHMRQIMGDAPRYFMLEGAKKEDVAALRAMHEQAQKYAKQATFTDELGKGLSKSLQQARNQSALLQFAIPFVRTPVNLVKFVGERTPGLALISRRVQADLASPIAEVRAAAIGKMVIGTGLWITAGVAAQNGKLTGGGPNNSDERAVLMASGWTPYSIRSLSDDGTITYTAYNRLDPVGMFLGISADIAETMGMLDEDEGDQVAMAAMAAVIKNLGSKTYFQGVSAILDALNDPDRNLDKFVKRTAASFVPNLFAQTNRTGIGGDETMREMRTLMDAIKARLPGFSKDLPPRRNMFGDVINYPMGYGPDTISPFFQSTESKSPIALEAGRLAQLGLFRFNQRAHYRHLDGVELTPEEQDEFTLLSAKDMHRNGNTLERDLDRLIKSGKYRNAGDARGGRPELINEVIGKHYRRAKREMIRRHRGLRETIRANKLEAQRARRSGTVDDLISQLRT